MKLRQCRLSASSPPVKSSQVGHPAQDDSSRIVSDLRMARTQSPALHESSTGEERVLCTAIRKSTISIWKKSRIQMMHSKLLSSCFTRLATLSAGIEQNGTVTGNQAGALNRSAREIRIFTRGNHACGCYRKHGVFRKQSGQHSSPGGP